MEKEKISELFKKTKNQTVMLRNFDNSQDPNFEYFSNCRAELFPNAFVILHPNEKPTLVASKFEENNADKKLLRVHGFGKEKQLLQVLKRELKGKKIGLNLSVYPVNSLKRLKKLFKGKSFFDASKALSQSREIKTGKEIEKIKQAVKISEDCLERFPEILKAGKTEKQAAMEIHQRMLKEGADSLAFPTIVASGTTAASIHHAPTSKKIKKGELILVDFGARKNCYCSDLTRMFCVGAPTEKQKELFNTVQSAKEIAQAGIKPGLKAKNVFIKANDFLKTRGFELAHALGHGLGIETHDYPAGFSPKSETTIKEKMVFTVEPGIYGKFGGIRLEDDILTTENGFRFLSKPQKQIIQV